MSQIWPLGGLFKTSYLGKDFSDFGKRGLSLRECHFSERKVFYMVVDATTFELLKKVMIFKLS